MDILYRNLDIILYRNPSLETKDEHLSKLPSIRNSQHIRSLSSTHYNFVYNSYYQIKEIIYRHYIVDDTDLWNVTLYIYLSFTLTKKRIAFGNNYCSSMLY